jgi:hypothetical protein
MDVPELDASTRGRAVLVALVAYVALLTYALVTGDPTATLAADAVFGVAMMGIGAYLLWRLPTTPLSSTTASLLFASGLAALGEVATGAPLLGTLSDLLLLAGLALYVLLWRRRSADRGRPP